MCLLHYIGGAFNHKPEELKDGLSQKAGDLIKRAFDDIDPGRLIDHHTHIAGIGTGNTNAFVNAKLRAWAHPFHQLKFKVYMSAAGVDDVANADTQLVERLASLVQHIEHHGKHCLPDFD